MNNVAIILFIIILVILALVMIFAIYNKRKKASQINQSIDSSLREQIEKDIADMQEIAKTLQEDKTKASEVYGSGLADIDLKLNDRYLTEGIAEPNKVLETMKSIGLISLAVIIGPDDVAKISLKGLSKMTNKLATSAMAKASTRLLPKLAIKAGISLSKNLAKLTNPVGWVLMILDIPGMIFDISDTGKLSNIILAKEWLELRDNLMKEFNKNTNNEVFVVGPLDKRKKEETYEQEFQFQLLNQQMVLTDLIINEKLGPNASDEQFWAEYENSIMQNEDKILNMTMKAMCEKYGGKYLGKNNCSYKTKSECDSSYTWPIKDYEKDGPYVQWDNADGGKCVATFNMREICEEQGNANIGYDYENKTCIIKEPYCRQFGYQYKEKDPDVNNFPNCYKTTGREVLDVIFGETTTKEVEDLFSKEENCGNRCGPQQYCYTVTGKGGICLNKSKVGETCPTEMPSCVDGSQCKISSEGIAAAAGTVALGALTGGLALTFPALVTASAGSRAIHANLGMCTAGQDGVNAPSPTNPGHFIPLGKKGCSAVWPCPTNVKTPTGTVPYTCHNAFLECQPPRKENETCDVVRTCDKGLWCGGVPIVCRKPGKVGDFCPLDSSKCEPGLFCGANSRCSKPQQNGTACVTNSACQSGVCLGGVCATRIGGRDYVPKGATCVLANTRCEPGTYCDGIKCQSKKEIGEHCSGAAAGHQCKSGNCGALSFKCYDPNDPCECALSAKGYGECGDWDASGFKWCYVKDGDKCRQQGRGGNLTKGRDWWKKC
jgi:hypothetical protein